MQYVRSAVLCLSLCFIAVIASAQAARPDVAIDAATRKAVVAELGVQLKTKYVFPDVATKMAAELAAREAQDAYDRDGTARAFAAALGDDLRELGNDRHLRVDYVPGFKPEPADGQPPTAEELASGRKEVARDGFGIARVERLPGNVGYMDLRSFPPAELLDGAYASAMGLLAGSDALILDLRRNGGGDPQSVAYLLSHFFAPGDYRHLNDIYDRPHDITREYWTLPVAGAHYAGPVYVLVSARTFSGGEECAYDLQTQKRATLVGKTTGGGANPGQDVSLGHGFAAVIPTGRAINPVTRTNWEHVGVKPDIAVPAADAMRTAYATILKKRVAETKGPRERDALKAILARVERGESEQPDYTPPHR